MQIQKIAVTKALALLKAAECKFKIIELDGTEHGELLIQVEPPPRIRAKSKYPHGTIRDHIGPHLAGAQDGKAITIPYGMFDSEEDRSMLQGAICAHLTKTWGKSSYLTHKTAAGVQVLRTA